MSTDMLNRLRGLEDESAIVDLLHGYGHALDYGRSDAWLDLFETDALYELRYRDGLVPRAIGTPVAKGNIRTYQGRQALEGFARAHSHAPDRYHKHLATNWRITIEGDAAEVDSYFARIDAVEGGTRIVAAGRYRDRMRRGEDGCWRIAVRIAEIEMQHLG